mgnify:CR=1 FL=1
MLSSDLVTVLIPVTNLNFPKSTGAELRRFGPTDGVENLRGLQTIARSNRFTKNDRVANGTGIPAEPRMMEGNEDIQELLELKKYKSAINTFRHM